jgi:hypothetical protein
MKNLHDREARDDNRKSACPLADYHRQSPISARDGSGESRDLSGMTISTARADF